jgi:hypothetical protein
MRRITVLAAALLTVTPTLAQAAEPPCLSPPEFTALADYALPSVISGASQRCSASLPANAFLRRGGDELIRRYAERRSAAWPGAKAAFLKLSNTTNVDANNLIRTLPDPSMQQMLDSLMAGLVAQHLPVDRCGAIDRLLDLLSPLPAASTAEVITLAVGLGAKAGRAKLGALSICEASAAGGPG